MVPLLKWVGLKYFPQVLVHDEVYAIQTRKPADKVNIVSVSFSSHPSIRTLERASGRVAIILPRTGWFDRAERLPLGIHLDFTARTMNDTYVDLNGNFMFDPGSEKSMFYEVAAVAQKIIDGQADQGSAKPEARMALLGSVDALADLAIRNRANAVLALDTIKWLVRGDLHD